MESTIVFCGLREKLISELKKTIGVEYHTLSKDYELILNNINQYDIIFYFDPINLDLSDSNLNFDRQNTVDIINETTKSKVIAIRIYEDENMKNGEDAKEYYGEIFPLIMHRLTIYSIINDDNLIETLNTIVANSISNSPKENEIKSDEIEIKTSINEQVDSMPSKPKINSKKKQKKTEFEQFLISIPLSIRSAYVKVEGGNILKSKPNLTLDEVLVISKQKYKNITERREMGGGQPAGERRLRPARAAAIRASSAVREKE